MILSILLIVEVKDICSDANIIDADGLLLVVGHMEGVCWKREVSSLFDGTSPTIS